MIRRIERDELKAKIDSGEKFVLLEAMPQEQYAEVHLPRAAHLPPTLVREMAPTLIPDRLTEVIVYCQNGESERSTQAARELDDMAYANVRHYAKGKEDWIDAGLPTEP